MPSHFRHVRLFAKPRTIACQAPLSMDSPGKNTGVGCHLQKWLYCFAFPPAVRAPVTPRPGQRLLLPGSHLAFLMGVWWGLTVLVCISLMTCDMEHLFIGAYLPSVCFVEVSVQVFILYFNQVVFLLLSFKSFLHTFLMYFYIFCICELLFPDMFFAYILPQFSTCLLVFLITVFCRAEVFNCSEVQFCEFFSCMKCLMLHLKVMPGHPWWLSGKDSACQCRRHGLDHWSGRIPRALEQLNP